MGKQKEMQVMEGPGVKALSLEEHDQVVKQCEGLIAYLPADVVRNPPVPVPTFVHEGLCLVRKAKEEFAELKKAGLPDGFVEKLEQAVTALQSAQVIHETERRLGRSLEAERALQKARTVRGDTTAACQLALRRDPEELKRLETVKTKGEAPPDVVAALANLGVLITGNRGAFEEIGRSPDDLAAQVAAAKAELEVASTEDHAARALSLTKETRDRLYALVTDLIGDLRAFARFAFRSDTSKRRGKAFTSDYLRARNRAYRTKPPVSVPEEEPSSPEAEAA